MSFSNKSSKNILFLTSGSIASFKAAEVVSQLAGMGHQVQVVQSSSSARFVGASTFEGLTGKAVLSNSFDSGRAMEHIQLERWADLLVLCPATAHRLNSMAAGVGQDPLTDIFLAHNFKKPFLVFPAMNSSMWDHPTTQKSVNQLQSMGLQFYGPSKGSLACGEKGTGRLLEAKEVMEHILKALSKSPLPISFHQNSSLEKPPDTSTHNEKIQKYGHILVTTGATQEAIDDVRILSNRSTGTTGIVLAEALVCAGFKVTLLRSESSLRPQKKMREIEFSSYNCLRKQLCNLLENHEFDALFMAAAVSDYSIESLFDDRGVPVKESPKLDTMENLRINLKRNPKLIRDIKTLLPQKTLTVGFKLTSQADKKTRQTKVSSLLQEAHINYVVHNDLSEIGEKKHAFTIFEGNCDIVTCPQSKEEMAQWWVQKLISRSQKNEENPL